jgi:hypothetical protein
VVNPVRVNDLSTLWIKAESLADPDWSLAMFNLSAFACPAVVLLALTSPTLARPDFDLTESYADQQLAALPLPPDIDPPSAALILMIATDVGYLKNRSVFLSIVVREAGANGLPPGVADAVVGIESRYDPKAVGKVGEVGLMQVRPKTAAYMGFRGSLIELEDPETNVRLGVGYLAKAWRLADGDLCRALMKYRAGHRAMKMSPLSTEYCRRARKHLAAVGAMPELTSQVETTSSVLPVVRHPPKMRREKAVASHRKGPRRLQAIRTVRLERRFSNNRTSRATLLVAGRAAWLKGHLPRGRKGLHAHAPERTQAALGVHSSRWR